MATVSIADQCAEIDREIRDRVRRYPGLVERGHLRQDTAETKVLHLRAAAATLQLIEAHASGLRALIHFLKANDGQPDPTPDERAALLAHPGVAAFVAGFPDAVLVGIRPMSLSVPDGAPDDGEQQGLD